MADLQAQKKANRCAGAQTLKQNELDFLSRRRTHKACPIREMTISKYTNDAGAAHTTSTGEIFTVKIRLYPFAVVQRVIGRNS